DETGEEVLRAPVRIGESAPANCLLTTYRSVGFVVKKAGLVGESRFFPALPKTAVQQRQKMPSKSRVNEQM
ncbi:MAG: hypothetical protein KH060_08655, partial [Collinsella sp.]|nr:hypothetical protein [Collinsella sp.]